MAKLRLEFHRFIAIWIGLRDEKRPSLLYNYSTSITVHLFYTMHLDDPVNLPMPRLRECLVRHLHIYPARSDYLAGIQ
jgi:hypothetical protein